MFSIRDFKSSIENDGFIKTNHSQIYFSTPNTLKSKYADNQDILVRCESANIPAIWFTTDDTIRRYGYGPIDKAPHIPQFDPYTCVFIADKNGKCHKYFTEWLSSTVNFNSSKSMLSENSYGMLAYETQYRKEYVTDIFVQVYDVDTSNIMEYRLNTAFVQSIQEQPMSWQQQDDLVKLVVTFQYRDWSMVGQESTIVERNNRGPFNEPSGGFKIEPTSTRPLSSSNPVYSGESQYDKSKRLLQSQDGPVDFGRF